MGQLKKYFHSKLRASSLTEVIVATAILLTVFGIALLTLNNILISSIRNDKQYLDAKIEKLRYQYRNQKITLPYSNTDGVYQITINQEVVQDLLFVDFTILDTETQKQLSKKILANEHDEK